VYDRRVDGRETVFGNQGALYKNAMTFWDHETESVWSQVTGEVLFGPLEGAQLQAIPAAVESWSAWRETHPDTLVLLTPGGFDPEPTNPDFVIGVAIGGDAAGFRFPEAAERGVTNDEVGGTPLTVFARPDHLIRVWSREVAGRVLEPVLRDGMLEDPASGTAWDPATGRGFRGPLRDHALAPIPWASSFDWAWLDFHPDARIVG
jgi:hypothetical protein